MSARASVYMIVFFMPSVTSFVAAGRWFFQKYMNFVAQQVIE